MRVLITGVTGFVGRHLLEALKPSSHKISVLYRDENKLANKLDANVMFININELDWKKYVQNVNPEIVIHLAAYLTSADDEVAIEKLIEANILFGTHLLDALKNTEVKYFINTGTFAEYFNNGEKEDPAYLYAATKTAFRSILKYYQSITNFKIVNIIPYTIYGGIDKQQKLIDHIFGSTKTTIPLDMSPGEQLLDFIHISDVVDFYMQLLNNLHHFENIYSEVHLGTGIATSPKKIALLVESITNRKASINWGGISYRKRDTMFSVANKKLPTEFFEWYPKILLEAGLKSYIFSLENK
jgi:nucleoside-diphosphate-sugar epimerase